MSRWSQYSYAAQKHKRHRFVKFLIVFFILYVLYNCLTAFLFSVWSVENNTMQPGLNSGDRLLFTSFLLPWSRSTENPYLRGSIVLVDRRHENSQSLPLRLVDGAVRFFTAQRISIFSQNGQHYIKRIISLPGDEVSMSGYVFRVRAAGSAFSLTEYELSSRPYNPLIPQASSLWDESVPFSGNMDPVILGPDECFVASDDRSSTNDSRTWGPVPASKITARAVLRFWPFNRIGLF